MDQEGRRESFYDWDARLLTQLLASCAITDRFIEMNLKPFLVVTTSSLILPLSLCLFNEYT